MADKPIIRYYATMIDCPDPRALAAFYASLLDWVVPFSDGDYACAAPPGTQQGAYPCLSFQREDDYTPPVWPGEAGAQRQMAHLDFAVTDVEGAAARAIALGATQAPAQFDARWRVMLDPAGHPFCLCDMRRLFERSHFALL